MILFVIGREFEPEVAYRIGATLVRLNECHSRQQTLASSESRALQKPYTDWRA